MSHQIGEKDLNASHLKSGGLIPQRQPQTVTIRCMAPGGRLTAARLRRIADVAEKYGRGLVHLSVRMSPEILYVPLDQVEEARRELAEVGQLIATCGQRFRVPTACGGCEYNPNGLVETQNLAEKISHRFFGRPAFHKFKVALAGCPIDCTRSREMDLGFQGQVEPAILSEKCTGCTLCVSACQDQALEMKDGLPQREESQCLRCGACIQVCPFGAMTSRTVGYAVYAGGRHGKHPHVAYPVAQLLPEGLVLPFIEAVLDWYQEQGQRGERLGAAIDRVGLKSLLMHLSSQFAEFLLSSRDIGQSRWRKIFYRGVAEAFPDYDLPAGAKEGGRV